MMRFHSRSRIPCALRVAATLCVYFLVGAAQAQQDTWYVDDDAPGGDGMSWPQAFKHLQDALAAASSSPGDDEIRVAQGTYSPDRDSQFPNGTGVRNATFQLLNAVSVRGGFAGVNASNPDQRDVALNETILSGDLAGDDAPDFQNNDENSYNVVTADGVNQTGVLNGFTITAGNANGASPNDGGGAMVFINANPIVLRCRLVKNAGASRGGAVNIPDQGASAPKFVDCLFIENTVGGQGGAGVFSNQNSSTFINCAFVGSSGGAHGRSIYAVGGGSVSLTNCTLTANAVNPQCCEGGGIALASGTSATITNCIIWANNPDQIDDDTGLARVNYSDVQGGWPGTGNIDADPLFQDPSNGNVRLKCASPCRDVGKNSVVPADEHDVDDDGDRTEKTPDPDLQHRILFLEHLPSLSVVDMGSFESHNDCPIGDCAGGGINGDFPNGKVDVIDLNALQLVFGKSGGPCDVSPQCSGDGVVNVLDLIELLLHFGETCGAAASGGPGGESLESPGPLDEQPWMIQLLAVFGFDNSDQLIAWLAEADDAEVTVYVQVSIQIAGLYLDG